MRAIGAVLLSLVASTACAAECLTSPAPSVGNSNAVYETCPDADDPSFWLMNLKTANTKIPLAVFQTSGQYPSFDPTTKALSKDTRLIETWTPRTNYTLDQIALKADLDSTVELKNFGIFRRDTSTRDVKLPPSLQAMPAVRVVGEYAVEMWPANTDMMYAYPVPKANAVLDKYYMTDELADALQIAGDMASPTVLAAFMALQGTEICPGPGEYVATSIVAGASSQPCADIMSVGQVYSNIADRIYTRILDQMKAAPTAGGPIPVELDNGISTEFTYNEETGSETDAEITPPPNDGSGSSTDTANGAYTGTSEPYRPTYFPAAPANPYDCPVNLSLSQCTDYYRNKRVATRPAMQNDPWRAQRAASSRPPLTPDPWRAQRQRVFAR